MMDNSLRVSFDYRKPDEAALVVYKTFGGGYFVGSEPTVSIAKTVVGKRAVRLYSELSGKSIEQIEKEAESEE